MHIAHFYRMENSDMDPEILRGFDLTHLLAAYVPPSLDSSTAGVFGPSRTVVKQTVGSDGTVRGWIRPAAMLQVAWACPALSRAGRSDVGLITAGFLSLRSGFDGKKTGRTNNYHPLIIQPI